MTVDGKRVYKIPDEQCTQKLFYYFAVNDYLQSFLLAYQAYFMYVLTHIIVFNMTLNWVIHLLTKKKLFLIRLFRSVSVSIKFDFKKHECESNNRL